MKKHLSLCFLVCMGFVRCVAQDFIYHSDSPFGIQIVRPDTTRAAQTSFFYDYDGDGDLDMFLTGLDYFDDVEGLLQWKNIHFFIEWQENIGDAYHPQFAEREDLFPDFPYPAGYFFPDIGDLDGDDDGDVIAGAEIDWIGNERLLMMTNTGISGKDQFDVSTMNNLPAFVPESLFKPHLTDLDQDGDFDLIASGFNSAFGEEDGVNVPGIIYARNIGTKANPDFDGWYSNPYEAVASPYGELITSGDIDNDGDVDLIGALINLPPDSITYLLVHLNTPGPNDKPMFDTALHSPFGLPTTSPGFQLTFPSLADLDGDGDLDLFVFRNDANSATLQYYENTFCTENVEEMSVTICAGEVLELGGEIFFEEGDYVVIVEETNGCFTTVLLHLSIEHVDNSVTVEDNVLTANLSGAFYQWFDCDSGQNIPGATNQSFIATSTGNYAVNITDNAGCIAVSECFNVVVSGIANDVYADAIVIYPNPAHDFIYLQNTSPEPVSSLTLTDVAGKRSGEFKVSNNKAIDVSHLAPGVYIARMRVNGVEIVKKLILL